MINLSICLPVKLPTDSSHASLVPFFVTFSRRLPIHCSGHPRPIELTVFNGKTRLYKRNSGRLREFGEGKIDIDTEDHEIMVILWPVC
jgi:hypothetical protein